MPYSQVKVYSDGSHYIGIPYEPNPRAKNRRPHYEEVIEVKEPVVDTEVSADDEQSAAIETEQTAQNPDDVQEKSAPTAARQMTRKELFDELYMQTFDMKKRERKSYIVKQMLPYFKDGSSCRAFVEQNLERKHRNMICRRTRLWRKINHQRFNFFVTFTYADDKMTEQEFAKKLLNTLYHFSSRKGWLYIGVWERGGDTNRLHFHGIFYIPPDGMVGELIEIRDYSTKDNRMQTASQNTYFLERYGRNDFQKLVLPHEVGDSLGYLMKYIEKSGERLVYGGKLPAYFESDVLDEDIIVPYGIDNRKAVLADDFLCMVEGEIMGRVSSEVIEKMPKVN